MVRRAAIASILAVLIASAPVGAAAAAAPTTEACPPITTLTFTDELVGSSIRYDEAKKRLTFTTEDGRTLEGPNARRVGKRQINVTSRTRALTIVFQADLIRGQARVSAVERDQESGAPLQFHRLYVSHGGTKLGPCRAVGTAAPATKTRRPEPAKPAASARPAPAKPATRAHPREPVRTFRSN